MSADLHSVVHAYLATLLAVSDAVGEACPPVGGPHQQRLSRLRTRLSFDSNKNAIEASSEVVREELRDFAAKSGAYFALATSEWKRAAEEIRDAGAELVQRQRFYASRLKTVAGKLDEAQAALLMNCAESMNSDAQSVLSRIHELLEAVEARVSDAETVDAATGLMNRREMDRRIALRKAKDIVAPQLLFQISCDAPMAERESVLRRVASRLTGQTRPGDLVARWSESEFLILFDGPEDIAERRGGELAAMLSTQYSVSSGAQSNVKVTATLLDRQPSVTPA